MITKKKNIIIAFLSVLTVFIISCEDPAPNEYMENNFVEAYLIVGEPIRNIVVMRTQPLNQYYHYDSSLISLATIRMFEDGTELNQPFYFENGEGYYYSDTTYLVKPNAKYEIQIELEDGTIITGETQTPETFDWIASAKERIYFPKDSTGLKHVDSLDIKWESAPNTLYYMLGIKCIDTVEYGKYMEPPTDEKNRRIYKPWSDNSDDYFREKTAIQLVPAREVPVVWNTFKWYGQHEIAVYAPDANFMNWIMQYFVDRYSNEKLNSVEGAYGVFGSASVVRDTFFLVKNQP